MKIAVGSKNPVKIHAVELAFTQLWPTTTWDVVSIAVPSGISDQPMSDEEAITGAKNRAKLALEKLGADFGIGLEGGLHQIGEYWFDSGWMVVRDKTGKEGIGSTVRAHTPASMMQHIHAGKELGEVCDLVFGKVNSKQSEGQFGLLTKNAVTRTSAYRDGLLIALAAFVHPDLY